MKVYVFDIETPGFNPDSIHCMSYQSAKSKVRSTTSYEEMAELITNPDIAIVAHNSTRFDIPVLERILGVECDARLVDTLALSWVLFPERKKHGLEDWGEEFGVPKPVVTDWEGLSVEEYIHRCEEDVKINVLLWKKCWSLLKRLYGGEDEAWRFIDYLTFKMRCAREQEDVKWKLDVKRCKEGIKFLKEEEGRRIEALAGIMPWVEKTKEYKKPAKMYLKGKVGVLGKAGEAWEELLRFNGLEDKPVHVLPDYYKAPNPGSIPQLKAWLDGLGWVPDEYKFVRDKKTGDVRQIPQINTQKPDASGLTDSVKLLYDKEPRLVELDGLFVVRHRIGILNGCLKDVNEEGFIRARIQGLTNTLRFKHSVVLNLPGIDKPYGELVRGCLIAPDGYELCGSDMSSLEDRCKQHYMWDYDPEYVKDMLADDFDPHLDLAEEAGAMTATQLEEYKSGNTKPYKAIRHTYKQGNYSCVYGAGAATVARSTGLTTRKAEGVVKAYWKRNWSVKAIAEDCVVKVVGGKKWLYNPVSHFWYSLRHEKDRFSTLNQGTGVFCFDTWLKHVKGEGPPIIGQMHDEWIALIKKGKREKMTKHVANAMKKTNEELKLNRELGCDIQFGNNYAEIH